MRILNVNIAINPLHGGGSAERTYELSKHLSKQGIECGVLTLDLGLTKNILRSLDDVEITAIPCMSERFFLPRLSPDVLKMVKDAIKRADIIHIMGHWSVVNAMAYIFAVRLNKPYVFCPAGTLLIHGRSKLLKRLYNLIIGNRIIGDANVIIASTADEISLIREYGVMSDDVVVITNGVNVGNGVLEDESHFRKKFGIGGSPFILFVGTFSPIKGPDLLLEAFNRVKEKFPSYRLVFAGTDRGMLPELVKSVKQDQVEDRVHFLGYVAGRDKVCAYNATDLLVVPSRSEVISMVALEAGSAGTPVLITDRCGFDEISEIEGGMVVPASVNGLEKGLIELLSRPERLKVMGKALQRHVTINYGWDNIIRKYIDLYGQMLV